MTSRRQFLSLLGASTAFALPQLNAPATAQALVQPPPGSPLRKTILDAVRPTFEDETRGEIEFVVRRLNVMGMWGFGEVKLQRPGGRAIDWRRTKYAESQAAEAFDPEGSYFLALMTQKGWEVVEFVVGPTEAAWVDWPRLHGAPRALFTN